LDGIGLDLPTSTVTARVRRLRNDLNWLVECYSIWVNFTDQILNTRRGLPTGNRVGLGIPIAETWEPKYVV